MKVILAGPRGFCAGVDRAIEIVEMALEVYGPPIYVRHEIIHNEHVVEQLREAGAIFTDFLSEVPRGSNLVFSAHGVSPAVRAEADARGLNVIDATCPLVTKIHLEVHKFLKRGYGIFFIGHRGHVETEGTLGEAPDRLMLVCEESEVAGLPEPTESKLIYLTQTTLSIDETRGIVDALRRRFPPAGKSALQRYLLCDAKPSGCGQGTCRPRRRDFGGWFANVLEFSVAASGRAGTRGAGVPYQRPR